MGLAPAFLLVPFSVGIGLALGFLTLVAFLAYVYALGLTTGDHILNPRHLIMSMLILVGLAAVAVVATIERAMGA